MVHICNKKVPVTFAELAAVPGIGETKASNIGALILASIYSFLDRNDLLHLFPHATAPTISPSPLWQDPLSMEAEELRALSLSGESRKEKERVLPPHPSSSASSHSTQAVPLPYTASLVSPVRGYSTQSHTLTAASTPSFTSQHPIQNVTGFQSHSKGIGGAITTIVQNVQQQSPQNVYNTNPSQSGTIVGSRENIYPQAAMKAGSPVHPIPYASTTSSINSTAGAKRALQHHPYGSSLSGSFEQQAGKKQHSEPWLTTKAAPTTAAASVTDFLYDL